MYQLRWRSEWRPSLSVISAAFIAFGRSYISTNPRHCLSYLMTQGTSHSLHSADPTLAQTHATVSVICCWVNDDTGCITYHSVKNHVTVLNCLGVLCMMLYVKKWEIFLKNQNTFRGPTLPLNLAAYIALRQNAALHLCVLLVTGQHKHAVLIGCIRKQCRLIIVKKRLEVVNCRERSAVFADIMCTQLRPLRTSVSPCLLYLLSRVFLSTFLLVLVIFSMTCKMFSKCLSDHAVSEKSVASLTPRSRTTTSCHQV